MIGFTAVVIPTNLFQPCRLETLSTLEQMQQIVGGYIEAVRVDWGRLFDPTLPSAVHVARQMTLYVNEEFRYIADISFNARASLLYPWHGGILGDAFLCGPPTPDGFDTDVPEPAREYFLNPSTSNAPTTPWR